MHRHRLVMGRARRPGSQADLRLGDRLARLGPGREGSVVSRSRCCVAYAPRTGIVATVAGLRLPCDARRGERARRRCRRCGSPAGSGTDFGVPLGDHLVLDRRPTDAWSTPQRLARLVEAAWTVFERDRRGRSGRASQGTARWRPLHSPGLVHHVIGVGPRPGYRDIIRPAGAVGCRSWGRGPLRERHAAAMLDVLRRPSDGSPLARGPSLDTRATPLAGSPGMLLTTPGRSIRMEPATEDRTEPATEDGPSRRPGPGAAGHRCGRSARARRARISRR